MPHFETVIERSALTLGYLLIGQVLALLLGREGSDEIDCIFLWPLVVLILLLDGLYRLCRFVLRLFF